MDSLRSSLHDGKVEILTALPLLRALCEESRTGFLVSGLIDSVILYLALADSRTMKRSTLLLVLVVVSALPVPNYPENALEGLPAESAQVLCS